MNKKQIKARLEQGFPGVKLTETKTGYKFNVPSMTSTQMYWLVTISNVLVKRSGTGLVVIC